MDENGDYKLGGTLPIAPLYVPASIALEGDRLVWNYGEGHWKNPDKSLLRGFIDLADALPDDILSFARRWGLLHLCNQHHVPVTHRDRQFRLTNERFRFGQCRIAQCKGGFFELIEDWRTFAKQARAIARLSSTEMRDAHGVAEDIALLWNASARPILRVRPKRSNRRLIVDAVNTWLGLADMRVFVTIRQRGYAQQFSGGLFGAIGLRLAASMAGSTGFAFCFTCGRTYKPFRTPSIGRRNYCPQCRSKAADRDAHRAARRREKDAREQRRQRSEQQPS